MCRKCEDCNGTGYIYFAENIVTEDQTEVTEATYYALPPDEKTAIRCGNRYRRGIVDKCETCGGDGIIEDGYVPENAENLLREDVAIEEIYG